jgi:hypothetical protein
MSFQSVLPRKIGYESCRLVGRRLEQHTKQYSGSPLHPDVVTEIDAVMKASQALDSLSADSTTILTVDRGADSFIAAYHDGLDALERSYNHGHLVELTMEEKARLEAVQRVRFKLFPEKTEFIKKSNHIQWSRMQDIKNLLVDDKGNPRPEINADLELLGVLPQTERLLRWIQKYGEAIGSDAIVEQRVKKQQEATDTFLEAWENFVIEARSALRKTTDAKVKEAYTTFLGLYDDQAQRELEIETRYRKAAEKKATEKSTETPTDSEKS